MNEKWWEEWGCMETHPPDQEEWERGKGSAWAVLNNRYTFVHIGCKEGIEFKNEHNQIIKGHIVYMEFQEDDVVYCGGCMEPAPLNAWRFAKITGANVVVVDKAGKKQAFRMSQCDSDKE